MKAYRQVLEEKKIEAQKKQVENRKKQIAKNQEYQLIIDNYPYFQTQRFFQVGELVSQ